MLEQSILYIVFKTVVPIWTVNTYKLENCVRAIQPNQCVLLQV